MLIKTKGCIDKTTAKDPNGKAPTGGKPGDPGEWGPALCPGVVVRAEIEKASRSKRFAVPHIRASKPSFGYVVKPGPLRTTSNNRAPNRRTGQKEPPQRLAL